MSDNANLEKTSKCQVIACNEVGIEVFNEKKKAEYYCLEHLPIYGTCIKCLRLVFIIGMAGMCFDCFRKFKN